MEFFEKSAEEILLGDDTEEKKINKIIHGEPEDKRISGQSISQEEFLNKINLFKEKNPKTRVWILTPCYNSSCYVGYVNSLLLTIDLFRQIEIEVIVEFCRNDSLVPRARNNMIARAMNDPLMTHIMFIDADIIWNPVDILKLLITEKELVGGIYPLKRYNWNILLNNPVQSLLEKKEKSILNKMTTNEEFLQNILLKYNINYESNNLSVNNSLASVKHIPTGFMLIRRVVIEKMIEAFPSTKYTDDISYLKGDENNFAYALFDCSVENDHYLSEDWLFCQRWSNIGGSIWADISTKLTHTGVEDYNGFILSSLI